MRAIFLIMMMLMINRSGASNDSTPRGQDGLRAAEVKRVQLMNIVV